MRLIVALSALVAVSSAIVCPSNFCDNVHQPLLNCLGGVLKGSGFCGCTDSCAKVEFETCDPSPLLGLPHLEKCDEGLECKTAYLGEGSSHSICMNASKSELFVSKRSAAFVCPPDACDNVKQEELNCLGGVREDAGVCGCTDVCALVEGEECNPGLNPILLGLPNMDVCDEGLSCQTAYLGSGKSSSRCTKAEEVLASKRSNLIVCPDNACENVVQKELNCLGGILKSGFCGCENVCAKTKGETCQLSLLPVLGLGAGNDECDENLACKSINLEGHMTSRCVDPSEHVENLASKRSEMIVCPPGACDNVEQKELNCKGGVIPNAGFCGCTDECAMQEGEECYLQSGLLLDFSGRQECDKGLVCKDVHISGKIHGECVKETEIKLKRAVSQCDTPCRKKTTLCTFSFVIYPGQWFAKCDIEGNFLAEQCNNKKECFCVDHMTGDIDESTRVLGSANCF